MGREAGSMSEYIFELDNLKLVNEPMQREEIVRCRDCRYGVAVIFPEQAEVPSDYLDCTGYLVTSWDYFIDEPQDNPVPPDGFCAWGVRRES
jgi:hypothetical protein